MMDIIRTSKEVRMIVQLFQMLDTMTGYTFKQRDTQRVHIIIDLTYAVFRTPEINGLMKRKFGQKGSLNCIKYRMHER